MNRQRACHIVAASAPIVVVTPVDHSNNFKNAACPTPIPAGVIGIADVNIPVGTMNKQDFISKISKPRAFVIIKKALILSAWLNMDIKRE